jgi:hypothetical protein
VSSIHPRRTPLRAQSRAQPSSQHLYLIHLFSEIPHEQNTIWDHGGKQCFAHGNRCAHSLAERYDAANSNAPAASAIVLGSKGHGFSPAKMTASQRPFLSAEGQSEGAAVTTELPSSLSHTTERGYFGANHLSSPQCPQVPRQQQHTDRLN